PLPMGDGLKKHLLAPSPLTPTPLPKGEGLKKHLLAPSPLVGEGRGEGWERTGVSMTQTIPSREIQYAELHCVSNFTFLRGASHPGELVYQAYNLGYSALALTDECSMAGVVRAPEAAEDCGLKLIIGAEFRRPNDFHVVLLAP